MTTCSPRTSPTPSSPAAWALSRCPPRPHTLSPSHSPIHPPGSGREGVPLPTFCVRAGAGGPAPAPVLCRVHAHLVARRRRRPWWLSRSRTSTCRPTWSVPPPAPPLRRARLLAHARARQCTCAREPLQRTSESRHPPQNSPWTLAAARPSLTAQHAHAPTHLRRAGQGGARPPPGGGAAAGPPSLPALRPLRLQVALASVRRASPPC